MKTILVTGGSGIIGRRLSEMLRENAYKVLWLSRERHLNGDYPRYRWNYHKQEIEKEALEQADFIIHLAGSNLGDDKWTRRKKQEIVESRVQTATLLLETVRNLTKKPEAFISASAIGFYGMYTSDKIFTEDDYPARNDFLSRTCKKWEAAARAFHEQLGIRTVLLRTAFVLSEKSEAFKKMQIPVTFGLAAPLGSGKQYMPWIHLDDLCRMYLKVIEDTTMHGVYNAVSPESVTNALFMKTMAKEMNRPFFFPKIPAFMLRLIMGEAAEMVLEGSRVSSRKIEDADFQFIYPTLSDAIRASLK